MTVAQAERRQVREWTVTTRDASATRALLRRIDLAILALMAVTLVAAFYRIGTKGLWLDESFSAKYATYGLGELWHVISGRDPNMGLYYAILHVWVLVFGSSETAVRSLSAIAGTLAIPFAVLLGTRLFGRTAGLLTGLLLALDPFFLHFEQTARSYALVVLLVLASSYAFVSALDNPSRKTLLGYVLASGLAVYAHYFAALVLGVQFLTLLVIRPPHAVRRRWAVAVAAVILLCPPAAVFASHEGISEINWIGSPTLGELVRLPSSLAGGTAIAVVVSLLACWGFVWAIANHRRWQAGFVAAWLVVPVALDFAVSELGRPLFIVYYLIVVMPALLLLAAAGISALPRKALAVGATVLVVVLMLAGMRSLYGESGYEGYRGATQFILGDARKGDDIVYYPELRLGGPTAGFAYYESRASPREPRPTRVLLASTTRARGDGSRVWLVIRDSDVPARRREEVERSIAQHYTAVERQTRFRNLTVVLYKRDASFRHA